MTNSANHLPNFLLSLTIRVIAAILAGVILLTLVFLIPADAMEENIITSAHRLSQESTKAALYNWCTSTLDNWTDSVMLLHAAYQDDLESPVRQAMYGYWYLCDYNPHFSFVNQYVHNVSSVSRETYVNYWHGYLLWLKPLLCFTSYQTIRWINAAVQSLLLLVLVFLMVKKKLALYIPPVLISVGLLMPIYLAKSLQCSSCYYMMLLGCIAVVAMKEQLKQKEALIFLWIGIGVAFFDFLTYPMATIGVPAALCFVICNGPTFKQDFCRLFKICFSWCFGYGGMWAGKWVAGSILTGTNMISVGTHAFGVRVNVNSIDVDSMAAYGASSEHPLWDTVFQNWDAFWRTPVTKAFWACLLVMITIYVWRIFRNRQCLKAVRNIAVLAMIACMPFVWYLVVSNHSLIHSFFTNKALVTFAFALLCMGAKLVESTKLSYKRKE